MTSSKSILGRCVIQGQRIPSVALMAKLFYHDVLIIACDTTWGGCLSMYELLGLLSPPESSAMVYVDSGQ